MGNTFVKPQPSPSVDRLSQLSKDIEQKTKILTDRLAANGQDAPSLQPGGLADFPLDPQDTATVEARQELITLTKELNELVQGPREVLRTMAWDSISYISLNAICEFKIAESVPRSGVISYTRLAREVACISGYKIPAHDLRRLCRLAITNNIFQEPQPGLIAHNSISLLMLDDKDLASWVNMFSLDFLGPIACTVPAMKRWVGSDEMNETGVNFSYSHSLKFFDHLQADPIRFQRYDQAMRAQSGRDGWEVSHTVSNYPWADLQDGTVVDVGGNEGYVSFALANSFPSLSFVVQDLPSTRTDSILSSIPPHLQSRVHLTTHDFFNPQPVQGAEAYFFRYIFHAFPDKYAIEILRNLIPALKTGSRVVINDMVLPKPGSNTRMEEKAIRTMDVIMKMVTNAREREIDDWKDLFEMADHRFKWRGAWKSTGKLWFIEAVWEDSVEGTLS